VISSFSPAPDEFGLRRRGRNPPVDRGWDTEYALDAFRVANADLSMCFCSKARARICWVTPLDFCTWSEADRSAFNREEWEAGERLVRDGRDKVRETIINEREAADDRGPTQIAIAAYSVIDASGGGFAKRSMRIRIASSGF
jgi:hypothetical protein